MKDAAPLQIQPQPGGAPLSGNPMPGAPAQGPGPANDPLAGLRDIHLPDPPLLWPPAPGWWILAGLIMVILAVVSYLWLRRYQRNRYRRLALAELQHLENSDLEPKALLDEISQLIQRTLRHGHMAHGPGLAQALKPHMPAEYVSLLTQGRYLPTPDIKSYGLIVATRTWIKQHKRVTNLKGGAC